MLNKPFSSQRTEVARHELCVLSKNCSFLRCMHFDTYRTHKNCNNWQTHAIVCRSWWLQVLVLQMKPYECHNLLHLGVL